MPDRPWRVWEAAGVAALPAEAIALFAAQDLFSSRGWYRAVAEAALPSGARAVFLVVQWGEEVLAVWPMQRGPGRYFAALTTPYTCLWAPLFSPAARAVLVQIGFWVGRFCRSMDAVRLDALDAETPFLAPLLEGFQQAGLRPLQFDHFGNWYLGTTGWSWEAYLAARPGALRAAIRRRGKKLAAAQCRVIAGMEGLEEGISQYERVYAASWKQPEPFPAFNAALMRECAAEGSLRLGLLAFSGAPVAAQFWVVRGGSACVLKLAHDEKSRALSPGTVLTALMIRRMLEEERVDEIDFGRGDDDYKKLWTGQRRQRIGFLLANARSARGVWEIGRRALGDGFRFLREKGLLF